jgi:DNA ligase-1
MQADPADAVGVPMGTPFELLVTASNHAAATPSRHAKRDFIGICLEGTDDAELPIAVAFLSGETRQGRLGTGYATLAGLRGNPAVESRLTLAEVDATFAAYIAAAGKGSAARRTALLRALFARATADEQDFLLRLLTGELRQGALEGVMIDAIAAASGIKVAEVRRAAMLTGDLGAVATIARSEGAPGLARLAMTLHRPLQPMLAQSAEDVAEALAKIGTAAVEWKLDGARVQVHKSGNEVRVFTRSRNDVTIAVPEIVEQIGALPATELILDGEAIALGPGGAPRPFQVTMRRFGRRLDVESMRAELPLAALFFDCLHRDGEVLLERSGAERYAALAAALPAAMIVPRIVTADVAEAQAFYDDALARGHEGVMVKSLDAPYEAGSRGAGWLKVKRARTLDLIVLAAEWGSGRRRGWLSNLHLGARDPAGGFVMLGKTFKGMTDQLLAWQTAELLAREVSRDGHVMHVRPELVVEIAFNDLQASPVYPGGLALRFARVKGYRLDKRIEDADTIDRVRELFEAQSANLSP